MSSLPRGHRLFNKIPMSDMGNLPFLVKEEFRRQYKLLMLPLVAFQNLKVRSISEESTHFGHGTLDTQARTDLEAFPMRTRSPSTENKFTCSEH